LDLVRVDRVDLNHLMQNGQASPESRQRRCRQCRRSVCLRRMTRDIRQLFLRQWAVPARMGSTGRRPTWSRVTRCRDAARPTPTPMPR
jgi:hypothetical protein